MQWKWFPWLRGMLGQRQALTSTPRFAMWKRSRGKVFGTLSSPRQILIDQRTAARAKIQGFEGCTTEGWSALLVSKFLKHNVSDLCTSPMEVTNIYPMETTQSLRIAWTATYLPSPRINLLRLFMDLSEEWRSEDPGEDPQVLVLPNPSIETWNVHKWYEVPSSLHNSFTCCNKL